MQRAQRVVGVILVFGLLIGAAVAFAIAQAEKSAVHDIDGADLTRAALFAPGCDCPNPTAPFTITLNKSARLDVTIVAGGQYVRSLLQDAEKVGVVSLVWDGRRDDGTPAADGRYRVRVRFGRERSFLIPGAIVLDARPPRITATLPTDRTIAYGAPGKAGSYSFTVASDEPANVRLTVYRVGDDGSIARTWWPDTTTAVSPGHPATLTWPAAHEAPDRPAQPGTYIVGYAASDAASNEVRVPAAFRLSALAPAVVVRVRTIEIDGLGHVLSDAPTVRVELRQLPKTRRGVGRPTASGPPATVAIPKPSQPGLYAAVAYGAGDVAWSPVEARGRAATLIVVPTYTWQWHNDYDAAGDGFPDVAPSPQSLTRPLGAAGRADLQALLTTTAPLGPERSLRGAISDKRIEDLGIPRTARVLVLADEEVWTPGLVARLASFRRRHGRIIIVNSPLDRLATRAGDTISVSPGLHAAPLAR